MSLTKVSYSMIDGAVVNALDFGADPTGGTNSATAINAAIASLPNGGVVFLPAGTYKTTAAINLNVNGVTLVGETLASTVIKPFGTFNAIQVHGASYASWANNRSVRQLTIDGSLGCTGIGLSVLNCGLRCYFADLYIHNMTGIGMKIMSSFDHVYERVECRANSSYGIQVYEKQVSPDGVYEEVSYLTFNNCWAIANNSAGAQWDQRGGDTCFFNDIKVSEGSIGINFSRNCSSMKINGVMCDGDGANTVVVNTATNYCIAIYIDGVRAYNCKNVLNVSDGQQIYLTNAFKASGTGDPYVYVGTGATGAVYLGQGISYTDARTTQQTYPLGYHGTYTPTFYGTGSALGNGTLTGSYTINGNVLTFQINLTFGSTTTMGTGAGFSVPLPIASGVCPVTSVGLDSSLSTYYSFQSYVSGSPVSTVAFAYGNAFVNATVPFTWATGDQLLVSGSYLIYQ